MSAAFIRATVTDRRYTTLSRAAAFHLLAGHWSDVGTFPANADEWNAGNRRSYVRRQTGRRWRRARSGLGTWRTRRWNRLLVWHDLHTQIGRWLVKQSCLLQFLFSLSLSRRNQYRGLLTEKSNGKEL